jgi:cellulose binding protein with CBM2 domain/Big-like domain-containing protein
MDIRRIGGSPPASRLLARRAAAGVVGAALLGGAALAGAPPASAQPAPPSPRVASRAAAGGTASGSACSLVYQVSSDWGSGFTATVTITNNGPAITSWLLQYSYTGNQRVQNGWSGNWSQSGQTVTVTNAAWNGSLATGATTTAGAVFSYSGSNAAPTAFTVNGVPCNGGGSGGTPPSVSMTSPAPGTEVPSGSTVTVAASASTGGSGDVASVTFYADNYCTGTATQIGVATSAPYSVAWAGVPVGDFGVSAVATTSQGASAMAPAVELITTSQGLPPPCPVPAGDPVIALVTPKGGTVIDSDTTTQVSAVTSIGGGNSISSVTFHAVDTCGQTVDLDLGTVATAPYTLAWAKPTPGDYTITAVAATGQGASVDSAPVHVLAGPNGLPPPCPTLPPSTPPAAGG